MIVNVKNIKAKDVEIKEKMDPGLLKEILDKNDELNIFLNNHIDLDITLSSSGKGIFLKGSFSTSLTPFCSRCVEEFNFDIDCEFYSNLFPLDKRKADSDDIDTYYNNEVDIRPIILEQLVLMIPNSFVCDEECQGLCQFCGINFNQETCDCEKKESTVSSKLADAINL
ncbi:MAG: YceD family protein [Pseudomonadota bacterium]